MSISFLLYFFKGLTSEKVKKLDVFKFRNLVCVVENDSAQWKLVHSYLVWRHWYSLGMRGYQFTPSNPRIRQRNIQWVIIASNINGGVDCLFCNIALSVGLRICWLYFLSRSKTHLLPLKKRGLLDITLNSDPVQKP